MVIFHSYVSLPEGTWKISPFEFHDFSSKKNHFFLVGLFQIATNLITRGEKPQTGTVVSMDNYPLACYSLISSFSEIYFDLSSMMVALENTLYSDLFSQVLLMKYDGWF